MGTARACVAQLALDRRRSWSGRVTPRRLGASANASASRRVGRPAPTTRARHGRGSRRRVAAVHAALRADHAGAAKHGSCSRNRRNVAAGQFTDRTGCPAELRGRSKREHAYGDCSHQIMLRCVRRARPSVQQFRSPGARATGAGSRATAAALGGDGNRLGAVDSQLAVDVVWVAPCSSRASGRRSAEPPPPGAGT